MSALVSLLALGLVLLGSVLHLTWNVMAKRAEDRTAFLWIAVLAPGLLGGVYYILYWREFATLVGLVCLVTTSIVHVIYFGLLAGSYRLSDLSFVYPYSRGVGAIVATSGGLLLLSERPKWLGAIGIALSVGAMFLEPLKSGLRRRAGLSRAGAFYTVGTGVLIGVYLLIDKVGVDEIDSGQYLAGMFFGMTALLAPTMLLKGRAASELKRSGWARPVGAGILIWGAYWTILAGMEMAPISYVAAVRSTGIVMAGFAGWLFLDETVGLFRWIAILLITIGVTCIGLA